MVKLYGKISTKKITGRVNVVPSVGEVMLQVKTVKPTYERQTITADTEDGYAGLSTVFVEPKDRALIETGATDKISNLILVDVHFPGGMAEDTTPPPPPPEPRYYYNGVQLPEIPADVLASYPYAWIRNNTQTGYYDLLLSVSPWYWKDSNSTFTTDNFSQGIQWYQVPIANPGTEWIFNQSYTTSGGFGNDANRNALWSNHDIPNGSATATDIYFEGSEPVVKME